MGFARGLEGWKTTGAENQTVFFPAGASWVCGFPRRVGISGVILCLLTSLRQNAPRDGLHPKMYVDAPGNSNQL